ncbi:MAG: hypothetical protein ACHQJ6_08040 [Candidatus Berkiellales bacterium]
MSLKMTTPIADSEQNAEAAAAITTQFDLQTAQTAFPVSQEEQPSAVLTLVGEGEQDKVEEMNTQNNKLPLTSGKMTDLAGRVFTDIFQLQYAVWALDKEMWESIEKTMPKEAIRKQLQAMENGSWVKEYGHSAEWIFRQLIEGLDGYSSPKTLPLTEDEKKEYYAKKVGGPQSLLPAHGINEYCQPGRGFREDFNKGKLIRTRQVENGEWMTFLHNGGKVGETFGYLRHDFSQPSRGRGHECGSLRRRSPNDSNKLKELLATRLVAREALFAKYLPEYQLQRTTSTSAVKC